MICRAALSLLLLLGLAPAVVAAQPVTTPPPFDPGLFDARLEPKYLAAGDGWDDYADRWRFRLTLSLWAMSAEGTVGKGDFSSNIDASFSDIFDKANAGAGTNFEVGKGPFSLLVFGQYLHLEADAHTPRGNDADATGQLGVVDIALAYQVLNVPVGGAEARFSAEALVGFRWTYLSAEVDINQGTLAGRSENREKNWFDPYVGTRLRFDFDRHWNISGIGTIGGFGVGSDLGWSAYGQVEYRFNETWSVIAGYRALSYDYKDDGFKLDVTLHGPVFGLSIRM